MFGAGWSALAEAIAHVQDGVRALAAGLPGRPGRLSWADIGHTLTSAVMALGAAMHELREGLERMPTPEGPAPELEQARERAFKLADTLDRLGDETIEGVRTAELGSRGFSLQLSPYDVSDRFRSLLDARHSAWIFTSATLSVGEDFSHFTSRLGLADAETLQIASPFDYERQSVLYLPPDLPDPAAANFIDAVMELSLSLIEASRGGAFILFTSHRGLSRGAQFLRARWQDAAPYPLFVQGDAPREQLLRAFRASGSGVLLGTASFWEGVDVKGSALRLVVIEKLPFASPDDPIVRAHIERIQQTGGNAFRDYQLPQAALALKQGVGRLIRSEEDFGAVAICDRRIVDKSYGRALRAALPPMSVTRDASEVLRFLARHSGVA
jgi:ATP-dependent DNA helicase DinG